MTMTIDDMRDKAVLNVSQNLYNESLLRTQIQEIFTMYTSQFTQNYDFATLDEEKEMEKLVSEILEEEIIFGYTLFLHTKSENPDFLNYLSSQNADKIRTEVPTIVETLLNGEIGQEGRLETINEPLKQLNNTYDIQSHYLDEIISIGASYGFYQGIVDDYKDKQLPLKATFKETIIGGVEGYPYSLTPLHFSINLQTTDEYEWHDVYGWSALNIEEKAGELIYFKQTNQLSVQLHQDVPEAQRDYIIDKVIQSINSSESLNIRISIVQSFLESKD